METINLDKNLIEIFKSKYVIPLYQRNYSWREDEISLLLLDIYENFKKNRDKNYFIGSLVVLKRRNGEYEVIDGQQRLTTITLLTKILEIEEMSDPKLFYDSRPEVESFFYSFYKTGKTNDVTFDHKVSHLIHAVDIIKETKINTEEDIHLTIDSIDEKLDFKKYVSQNVILVRVEIPQDTDVASYFEIMNNRGEQLQKHEILKAKLIEKIKFEDDELQKKQQAVFAKIWDACSQMDIHIQKLFPKEERTIIFGEDYNSFNASEIQNKLVSLSSLYDQNIPNSSIDDILAKHILKETLTNVCEDVENEREDKSIIDFPNFLMHVFKLLYNNVHKIKTVSEKNEIGLDIPLNEKDLLSVYDKIEEEIDSMAFISKLLHYKCVFDRYVVKASSDENVEADYNWSLEKPYKYRYTRKDNSETTTLKYCNTFDKLGQDLISQKRVIKSQSMLQVTYKNRKYKNWLFELLSWFPTEYPINYNEEALLDNLDRLAINYYNSNERFRAITKENPICDGTKTPHFLFNFIDYLYWVDSQTNQNLSNFDFEFNYRNSIEHHLPQSLKTDENKDFIDNLGNLCLVNKSSNSRMNSEAPKGKADPKNKYYRKSLPPKQKVMYDITNSKNEWSNYEIKSHYNDIVDLLLRRNDILVKKV